MASIVNNTASSFLPSLNKKGHTRLLNVLYKECLPIITSFILSHNGNIHDVDDVVQETFLYLVTHKKRRCKKRFRSHKASYIIASAKNIWFRELAYREKNTSLSSTLDFCDESAELLEHAILEQKQYRLYRNNLNWMSHECRKVIDYSIKKIPAKVAAQKLGYSEEAYKKRKMRYIGDLKKKIKMDPSFSLLEQEYQ